MATEQVLEVSIRRHIIESERPFASVLDGIFGGISRPDIGSLLSDLEASTSYEQFSSLRPVRARCRARERQADRNPGGQAPTRSSSG